MAADISVVINPPEQINVDVQSQPNQFDLLIGDGIPKHAETHAPGGSDSLSAYYVTGSVVRPSDTGNFITTSQTGRFVGTGQTGYYTGIFYPYSSNPNGYVQGAVVRPSNTGNFVDKTSVQTISNKYFTTTSFVNNLNPTGIIISGVLNGNYTEPSLIVFTSPLSEIKSTIEAGGDDGALAFYTNEGPIILESISKNYPIYLNGNVEGSQYAIFQSGVSGNNLVYNVSNQTISGIKSFVSRPTVGGTGVLLSGEISVVNTGSLTGAFYPLNSNPSGYITGVDLSNYVTKSSTGNFVTTGQTGSFIVSSQTGQFVSTGATGNFVTGNVVRPSETGSFIVSSQTGQFVSTGATGNFVTGSVVRPSETGNFITTAQTGQFVWTGATGSFVVSSQTGALLTTGAADGRYALQSATGAFITTGQTGAFAASALTGAFLTTGAADARYYTLSNGQSISGFATTGFNDAITGMTITGDATKVITLFQRGGATITGSFTDNTGSGGGSVNVNDSNLIISISMFA
jgi:hypothetical protein